MTTPVQLSDDGLLARRFGHVIAWRCPTCGPWWFTGARRRPGYWACPACGETGEALFYQVVNHLSLAHARTMVALRKVPIDLQLEHLVSRYSGGNRI